MHSLAPVLSATSRYVYIWIITGLRVVSGEWSDLTTHHSLLTTHHAQVVVGAAAISAGVGAAPGPLVTIRTRRQLFIFDSGRVSMISTVSPTRDSFFSSCT